MEQINNASHIGSLFGAEESFAVGKLQLAWLQPPRRCLLASARAPAGEPQKRLPGYLHGHIKNAPKNAAGDQLSHSGGHFQVICMSRYKCVPRRALPGTLLARSRGCCQGTRPGAEQHGPRGEAAAGPLVCTSHPCEGASRHSPSRDHKHPGPQGPAGSLSAASVPAADLQSRKAARPRALPFPRPAAAVPLQPHDS